MGGGAGEKRDFDTQLRYLFDPTQKTGVTEYTTSTERAHEGVAIPRIPRVDKNASDKEAVIDSTGFPPCFTSTNTAEFNRDTTTFSQRYKKREPCFDRQSSCATNYSLGEAPFETKTTNDVLFAHPLTKPRVDQGEIGGWKHADGSYKLEQDAIDSIKRGGGGGAGCLGISFNVITGEEIPGIREEKRAIYGARRTLNVTHCVEIICSITESLVDFHTGDPIPRAPGRFVQPSDYAERAGDGAAPPNHGDAEALRGRSPSNAALVTLTSL